MGIQTMVWFGRYKYCQKTKSSTISLFALLIISFEFSFAISGLLRKTWNFKWQKDEAHMALLSDPKEIETSGDIEMKTEDPARTKMREWLEKYIYVTDPDKELEAHQAWLKNYGEELHYTLEVPFLTQLRNSYYKCAEEGHLLDQRLTSAFDIVGKMDTRTVGENALIASFIGTLAEITEVAKDSPSKKARIIQEYIQNNVTSLARKFSQEGRDHQRGLCEALQQLWSKQKRLSRCNTT